MAKYLLDGEVLTAQELHEKLAGLDHADAQHERARAVLVES